MLRCSYYSKWSTDQCNSYQNSNGIFHKKRKINLKVCIESQKTLKSQSNLKKNKGGGIMPLISNYTQSHNTGIKMDMSSEWKRTEARHKPMHVWSINQQRSRQECHNRKKRISLIGSVGNTGQLFIKEQNLNTFLHHIQK